METEKEVAINAVLKAAQLCQEVQSDMVQTDAIKKPDRSPVTVADFGSQALICSALGEAFPKDCIVAEEDAEELRENPQLRSRVTDYVNRFEDVSSHQVCEWINRGKGEVNKRYWTLDPIDGTKGFLRRNQYAIALALIIDGEVEFGLLACPNLPKEWDKPNLGQGCLLVAVRGEGAYMGALDGRPIKQIQVADTPLRFADSVETLHGDHGAHFRITQELGITDPPIQIDSQAKYGLVARGEASVYLRLPNPRTPNYRECIWDHAAGIIIVEEAGGKVTDMHGQSVNLLEGRRMTSNRGIVATNGKLHERVLEIIRNAK
ncbi:MAG: 3'(2'),5'-bisphosphate nucleotidase [Candidatus Poribacteria bacterium]|nr:3'(2'),5'-bisphosphate nucleotidase [Candidatus Poribacteria bacterium]